MSDNFYDDHPLMISSGVFWRCKHGKTGLGKDDPGCDQCALEKIESLQAEIRKKDRIYTRLKSVFDKLVKYADGGFVVKNARIKDLEQQLANQRAWIDKLEEAWIVADGNILSLHRDHLRLDQVSEEKRLRYRQKAKEALEKLKLK
jgi:uncharacterized coiled-coil protein SlyX